VSDEQRSRDLLTEDEAAEFLNVSREYQVGVRSLEAEFGD